MAVLKGEHARDQAARAVVLDFSDLAEEAQRVLDQANEHAQRVIERARNKAQRLVDQGHAAGESKGYEDGYKEGLAKGREIGRAEARRDHVKELESFEARWLGAINDWNDGREALRVEAEANLISLAIGIAERVIARQVECDPTIVNDQLRAALELAGRPSALVVEVSPYDLDLVNASLPGLALEFGADSNAARVVPREDMERGGVILRTEGGRVDATITTQMERIVDTLMPAPPTEPGS